jgi:CHAD domain-containing protein
MNQEGVRSMPTMTDRKADREARKLVRTRWRALGKRARSLQEQGDSEALHRFRVALRRLRAVLGVCDEQLGLSAPKSTRRALKEMAAASGVQRDWEVVQDQLAVLLSSGAPIESWFVNHCDMLLAAAQRRAEKAFGRIVREHKPRLKKKIRIRRKEEPDAADMTMRQAMGRHLLQLLEETREYTVSPLLLPEPLHALRIAAKNMRYTLEELEESGHEDLLGQLHCVQERLGAVHDLDLVMDVLRRWERQFVDGGTPQTAAQFGDLLNCAAAARTARIEAWQREFPADGADLFGRVRAYAQDLAAPSLPA